MCSVLFLNFSKIKQTFFSHFPTSKRKYSRICKLTSNITCRSSYTIYKLLQNFFFKKKKRRNRKKSSSHTMISVQSFESTRDTFDPIARCPTAEDVPRRTTNLPSKNKSHLSETYSRKRRSVANLGRAERVGTRGRHSLSSVPFPCRGKMDLINHKVNRV